MTEHHFENEWVPMASAGLYVGLPIVAVVVGSIVGACILLRPVSTAAPMPAPEPVATMTLPSYPLAPEPAPPRPDTKIFEEFAATLVVPPTVAAPKSVPMPSHHRPLYRVAPDGRMNRGASEQAETARLNAVQIAQGDAPP